VSFQQLAKTLQNGEAQLPVWPSYKKCFPVNLPIHRSSIPFPSHCNLVLRIGYRKRQKTSRKAEVTAEVPVQGLEVSG